jgi:hypothetical protein
MVTAPDEVRNLVASTLITVPLAVVGVVGVVAVVGVVGVPSSLLHEAKKQIKAANAKFL